MSTDCKLAVDGIYARELGLDLKEDTTFCGEIMFIIYNCISDADKAAMASACAINKAIAKTHE